MESSLAILKKDVQCSLCNDTLIEPKLLSCFHTFCKRCIKRHAELIDDVNLFTCTECKSQTSLTQLSSVDDLKSNLLHSRMTKVLEFVESEKVCSVSQSHSPASKHCFDCNRSFCDECEKSHSLFITNHKVVSLVQTKQEHMSLLLSRESNCGDHIDKTIELFCKDCQQAICFECFKHNHEGHDTISLLSYRKSKKAFLSEQLKRIKIREQEMEKTVKAIEKRNKKFKQYCEKAKRDVMEKLEEIIHVLHKKVKGLMTEIDNNIETAEKEKVKGQSVLDQTRGVIDYMNKLIEKGIATELTHTEDLLHVALNNADIDDQIEQCQVLGMTFVLNERLMKQVDSGLGTLKKITKTDHTMSTVEVDGELEALKKSKLIVLTRNKENNSSNNPNDIIDVKIIPVNGKTEVEFMTKVDGLFTAEVKVNGNHVSNSPLVMNVKPQKMRRIRQFNMKGIATKDILTGISVNRDNSRIAVADWSSDCVYVFNSHGDLLLTYNKLYGPEGTSFLNDTELVIADCANHRICIVNIATGKLLKKIGSRGNRKGEFNHPCGVHVDDDGNIIVCDSDNHRVQVFTSDGDYQYQFGSPRQVNFKPFSTVTHGGRFYVSDRTNNVIHIFVKKDGIPTRISSIGRPGCEDGQLSRQRGLAIDNDDHLLVCDYGNDRIQKFTLNGRFVGKTYYTINHPRFISVLNDGRLMVTSGEFKVFYVE